jgi:pyrroloquinoline quinone biosynthesis protein B
MIFLELRLTILLFAFFLLGTSCRRKQSNSSNKEKNLPDRFLVILGIAQDAGYPQAGCEKNCCAAYWNGTEEKKHVVSLALVDRKGGAYWLFEATPDIIVQLHRLQDFLPVPGDYTPDGIFISHAHIGHYTGLMQLGREAMGSKEVAVFALPRLDTFLRKNGPWNQLVSLGNISPQRMEPGKPLEILDSLRITSLLVPHRDEYSETAGFLIEGRNRKVLFIPDIDKWGKWKNDIRDMVQQVDIALLDGTFYRNGELPGRDMREIPHPFVEETMQLFSGLPVEEKEKIFFIHFNHSNPLLRMTSPEKDSVRNLHFNIAEEGQIIPL